MIGSTNASMAARFKGALNITAAHNVATPI